MKKRLCAASLLFLLVLIFVRPGQAQNLLLKNGQTIATKGIRRSGEMVMCKIELGASSGEVGYQASTIAKIDFPEPPELKTTAAFLSQDDPQKALAAIGPVVKSWEVFRDLPGNWWAEAALLKVSALTGMQLDKEAERLEEEIRKTVPDPETAHAAQLQLTPGLIRTEQYHKVVQICDRAIKESARPEILAEAWLRKGDACLAQRKFDSAVLAYLHLPVFYANETRWMPPALLGTAKAFRGLDDFEQAKKSFTDLTAQFPKSPQADRARAELKKLTQ